MPDRRLLWLPVALLMGGALAVVLGSVLARASQAVHLLSPAIAPGDVVINEVAWMGTTASAADEWIELYNTTDQAITLTGWTLYSSDGGPNIALGGVIPAHGYYLIERTDDSAVSNVPADWTGSFGSGLSNAGEILTLTAPGNIVVDTANGDGGAWPAGTSSPRATMERIDPTAPDADENWGTNTGLIRNGLNANGGPITGTPKARNSRFWPDLVVEKRGPATVQPGGEITYSLSVHNGGPMTASTVYLTDRLPAAVGFVTYTGEGLFQQVAPDTLVWTLGAMEPGGRRIITLTGRVAFTVSGTLVNHLQATMPGTETIVGNNVAQWESSVVAGGTQGAQVKIAALLYDGYVASDSDEALQIVNTGDVTITLAGWQIGKEGSASRVSFTLTLPPGAFCWIARDRAAFRVSFGFSPDVGPGDWQGSWPVFANDGDAVFLLNAQGSVTDTLVYGAGPTTVAGWSGEAIQPYGLTGETGQLLYRKLDEATGLPVPDTGTAKDWAQDPGDLWLGRRVRYPGWDLGRFFFPLIVTETATITVAIAPDTSFAVVSAALASAQSSLEIASYTFENPMLGRVLSDRAASGVEVRLLLEGGPVGGVQDAERWVCQQLEQAGGGKSHCWFMDNGQGVADAHARYQNHHAKYAIIDGRRLLIGTENFGPGGMPFDDKSDGTVGNRGVILLIEGAPSLVGRMQQLFGADLDLAHQDIFTWTAGHAVYGSPPVGYRPITASGGTTYTLHFTSPFVVQGTFPFQLHTAPESGLRRSDGLFALLAQAGSGDVVRVEQLYEHRTWGEAPNLRLQAYISAALRGADVRLLLNQGTFGAGGVSLDNLSTVTYVNRLAAEKGLTLVARLGDPTAWGIHNKMVLARIGGRGYLFLGSLNGSEVSYKANREVGLLIQSDALYEYLVRLFDLDWQLSSPVFLPLVVRDYTAPADYPLISEVVYDGVGLDPYGEWVELHNPTGEDWDLSGWYLGDAVAVGEYGSGLYRFPTGTVLPAGGYLVVGGQANSLDFVPDLELLIDPNLDDPTVPNMVPAGSWEGFGFALGNGGDEVLLLDAAGQPVDVLVYGDGSYSGVIPHPGGVAAPGHSLERRPPGVDTDDCSRDFVERYDPTPGRGP